MADTHAGATPPPSSADAGTSAAAVQLVSIHNFRDVAGPGYHTPDGPMRRGVVYRSNVVAPSPQDHAVLHTLGVRRIVDLRTPEEVAKAPDAQIDGAEHININVLGNASTASTILGYDGDATPATARRSLQDTYVNFVVDASFRSRLAPVFTTLATTPGAAIVHCTAGKDRTGFVSAILQLLVGVQRDEVMADYLETNARSTGWIAEMSEVFHTKLPDRAAALVELLHVREEYLAAALAALDEHFGSARTYLESGLGCTAADVDELRARLVEG